MTATDLAPLLGRRAIAEHCFIHVNGGFGNQLFQYAFARKLQLAHGVPAQLDVSAYQTAHHKRTAHHRLYLDKLSLPIKFARLPAWRYEAARKMHKFPAIVPRWLVGLEFRKDRHHPRFTEAQAWKGMIINGAWQEPTWFAGASDAICEELRQGIGITDGTRDQACTISFHVRRGDYLTVGFMENLDYCQLLENARAHFRKQGIEDGVFQVFSDDPEWCRENLKGDDIEIRTGGSMLDDFRGMASCDHHVIANSSFSWWAAYLNTKPNKIVCAPARWLTGKSTQDIRILPEGWTELNDA